METFEALEGTASNQEELELITRFITSEKLRVWVKDTKEGQAVNAIIMNRHEKAIAKFTSCSPTDIEGLQAARIDVEVAKGIYEIFNTIFQDGDMAEKILNGEYDIGEL